MGIRKEIKEAISNGHLYDFVANNQHRISKDELVELVKNLDYTAYQNDRQKSYKEFCSEVIENLNDVDYFKED